MSLIEITLENENIENTRLAKNQQTMCHGTVLKSENFTVTIFGKDSQFELFQQSMMVM